jgi:hypothetical protein
VKKIFIAVSAALCVGLNPALAQENAGGAESSESAFGPISSPTVVATAVGLTLVGAMIANNRGTSSVLPGPDPDPDPDPVCEGTDQLIDGVCFGTETIVTVTGTGTNIRTIEITNTVTYLPTIP